MMLSTFYDVGPPDVKIFPLTKNDPRAKTHLDNEMKDLGQISMHIEQLVPFLVLNLYALIAKVNGSKRPIKPSCY